MRLETIVTVRRCAAAVLFLCAASAGAQMFKWVDAKGVVHYSDQPPPAQQAKVELKAPSSGASAPALPFELASAARTHPVLLYTTATCGACDQGRALLKARGVPFAERTVNSAADQEKLKQAGSLGRLPLLQVGHTSLVGFEEGNWNAALSAAAYPQQSMLPKDYTYAKAEPAAPPPPPAPPSAETLARANAAKAAGAAELLLQKPPPVNAPPNFQF
ncbi:MAG: glutaredoxin family protein [Telluria sp.]